MRTRLVSVLLLLAVMIIGFSCQKFDPFAPISNDQVASLLQKAKAMNPGETAPCDTLSQQQIQDLIAKVQEYPLDPVDPREVAILETNFGTMVIAFHINEAPNHCKAFKRLVKSGFYDCTRFHRVIPSFVIQGGDILTRDAVPENDGYGGPGYNLDQEFNDLPHGAGVVSMARSDNPNSAGSQFFICLSRQGTKALDGKYTVFGKVIGGLDVMEAIAQVPTKNINPNNPENSYPAQDVVIEHAYMLKR